MNLRPPRPQRGALTGLRYTPKYFASINNRNISYNILFIYYWLFNNPVKDKNALNLFETYRENILPFDGEVINNGVIINQHDASHYFDKLLKTIEWSHDELIIFGKHIRTKRKVAWYGDVGIEYSYSHKTKKAVPWTFELIELKKNVENITKTSFNSCLLNLYHNGEEGMSWHSDNEKELGENPVIASLSLGAQRKFVFKHRITKQKVSLFLESGSLLMMKGKTQEHWLHALPKTKKVNNPRINITFRRIIKVV